MAAQGHILSPMNVAIRIAIPAELELSRLDSSPNPPSDALSQYSGEAPAASSHPLTLAEHELDDALSICGEDSGSTTQPQSCADLFTAPAEGAQTSEQFQASSEQRSEHVTITDLPTEVLISVLDFLDVSDLLAASRTNHQLRFLALAPILQAYRLRRARAILPPLLWSPARPSLADLIARSIFLTPTTVVSRRLGRSLVSISLSRRLSRRPPAEVLVQRCVLPLECVPGLATVPIAPALVARRKKIERERIKDVLRRWVGGVWKGEVMERSEDVRKWEESAGIGRVWRLRRFWESVSRAEDGTMR